MARLFSTAKVGDTLVRTVSDPITKELWSTKEYTIDRLKECDIYFNVDKEPRHCFDCHFVDKDGYGDSLWLEFKNTCQGFYMPNQVDYFLKEE